MPTDNRWKGGRVRFRLPPLPQRLRFQTGVLFETATFNPTLGPEVFLLTLEMPPDVDETAGINPLTLNAKTGIVNTSAGPLAFILWSFFQESNPIVDYEHYIDAFDPRALDLLDSAAQQLELKVCLMDSAADKIRNVWMIPNACGLTEFVTGLRQVVPKLKPANFIAAQQAFKREFTIEQIKGL